MITTDGPYLISRGLTIYKQIIWGEKNELESWIKGKKVPSGELYALTLKIIKKQTFLKWFSALVMATNL